MSYIIYQSDGTQVTIPDNAIDTEFYDNVGGGGAGLVPPQTGQGQGIQLLGRNTVGYGASVAQNFLQLTENFCSSSAPADVNSLQGQLWFNQASSSSGNLYVRVNKGGAGVWQQLVTTSGTVSTATNLAGGASGEVPYQLSSGTTAFTAAGAAGQVFLSTGTTAPVWANQSTLNVGYATNLDGGTVGQIPYQTGANITSFITVGSTGQVLTMSGGVPSWQNPPAASVATSVTVTDNGAISASTFYPTFVAGAGTQGITISSPDLSFVPSTGALSSGRILLGNGTAAVPSLTFINEPVQDTGLYWNADGYMNFTNNGVIQVKQPQHTV